MSQDLAQWQNNNDRFLAAALAWLRLLLTRMAEGESEGTTTPASAAPSAPAGTSLFSFMPEQPTAPQPAETALDVARRQMDEAAAMDPPPALHLLSQRFGLSPFEQDVLLLCAAMELDTRIAGLCAQAQDDPSRPYPTFALALALFDEPAWDALSPERPLRYWRLIEINQPRRPAADDQRAARRRAHRQLSQRAELPRRPPATRCWRRSMRLPDERRAAASQRPSADDGRAAPGNRPRRWAGRP